MKIRSKAITDSARGQMCTLRLPLVCSFDPETTVFAHLPSNDRGLGSKASDLHGCYACASCHDVVDGRKKTSLGGALVLDAMIRALAETQGRLLDQGLIVVVE